MHRDASAATRSTSSKLPAQFSCVSAHVPVCHLTDLVALQDWEPTENCYLKTIAEPCIVPAEAETAEGFYLLMAQVDGCAHLTSPRSCPVYIASASEIVVACACIGVTSVWRAMYHIYSPLRAAMFPTLQQAVQRT